jgi:hypothetical protein
MQVPAIDVSEWRRRTVHHGTRLAGAGARHAHARDALTRDCTGGEDVPQVGWFWNYVEQCTQTEKAEVSAASSCLVT